MPEQNLPNEVSARVEITAPTDVGGDVVGGDKIVNVYDAPAAALAARHGLRAPPRDFTGREDALAELIKSVKERGVTILVIWGMGGIGKTALALKLAEQLEVNYPDGQFYVDLRGTSKHPLAAKEVMAHVIRSYNFTARLPESEDEIATLYRSILHNKRVLLLLDNARDTEPIQQVEKLIPPPTCLLLITSRWHFSLSGMQEMNLDILLPIESNNLLLRIAPRLAQETVECVDDLARFCGYLPLALRAVASAIRVQVNTRVVDYVRLLADANERLSRTKVDACLDVSYQMLSEDVRSRFRLLAAFPDTFDMAAAAAMWSTNEVVAESVLSEVLEYSLIGFNSSTGRYRLHDLVRLFADNLLDPMEREAAQRRHAEYYLKVITTADEMYLRGRGASVLQALALFDLEWGNIQAGRSFVAAQAEHDDEAAAWCCDYPHKGVYCLALRQHPKERIEWWTTALSAAIRLGDRVREGYAKGNLGVACYQLGQYQRALDYHEEHRRIASETGDNRAKSQALGNLGVTFYDIEDYPRAIECYEECLRIARMTEDRRREGNALSGLGLVRYAQGEQQLAIQCHQLHREIALEIGDLFGEAAALGNLGLLHHAMGQYRTAIQYYSQSFVIASQISDRLGQAHSLCCIGRSSYVLGDHEDGIAKVQLALDIYEEIGSPDASEARDLLSEWRRGTN